jgi:hypothetical protein
MTPRHAAALALAQRGIKVFPCAGKVPAIGGGKGFKDRSADPQQINAWWARGDWNIGVCPAELGWIALDLDHYKKDGVNQTVLDTLPPTRSHMTPSGGEHRFYKTAETFGNHRIAVNVDVRNANGYVLWPPSIVNGVEYRHVGTEEPIDLPERVAEHLRAKRDDTEAFEAPDLGEDIYPEEAREWCEWYAQHGDQSDRFYTAAKLVRNFGLTNETATELASEYGLRMDSDGDGTSWEHTLRNARKYGKGALGEGVTPWRVGKADTFDAYLTPAERAVAAQVEPSEDRVKRRFQCRRPSEAKNQQRMVWLDADNLFPSGPRIMVLYAEMANLKTQFVLAKALEIVNRADGNVLYIAAEDGHGIDTQRLPAYVERRGIDWPTLDEHWRAISEPIDLIRDSAQLTADVKAEGFAPDVVVIDVMTACTGALDINLPGVGNQLMNAAQQIANEFRAIVVLLTHPGKDGGNRGPVGSYAFTARADVVLLLKRQGDTLNVTVEKMKGGPAGHTFSFAVEVANGLPLVGSRKTAERKESPNSDDAIWRQLIAAPSAVDFASGLTDEQLAERIVGERRPDEDGGAYSTQVARMAASLKKRHKRTKHGENATMPGGKQLYWHWHLGPKVPTDELT